MTTLFSKWDNLDMFLPKPGDEKGLMKHVEKAQRLERGASEQGDLKLGGESPGKRFEIDHSGLQISAQGSKAQKRIRKPIERFATRDKKRFGNWSVHGRLSHFRY